MRTITESCTCALPRTNYTAPKSTVTFNLGYCNYKTFGNFCENGVLFVTRLKENAVKTQIWIALIVYLLFLKLFEQCKYDDKNFTYFCLYFESGSQPLLNIPSPFLFNR